MVMVFFVLVHNARLGNRLIAGLVLFGLVLSLASDCLNDAVVCGAAVVHEGLDTGELYGYPTWQLLGHLFAPFLGPVHVPASTGRRAIWCAGRLLALIVSRGLVIGIDTRIPYTPQPVVPGEVAAMHQYRLIVGVVAYVLEEDAAAEGRDLEGGDIYVGVKGVPGIRAYAIGHEGCEEAVEVEEEKDGQDAAY